MSLRSVALNDLDLERVTARIDNQNLQLNSFSARLSPGFLSRQTAGLQAFSPIDAVPTDSNAMATQNRRPASNFGIQVTLPLDFDSLRPQLSPTIWSSMGEQPDDSDYPTAARFCSG
jgi:hypothetical protein